MDFSKLIEAIKPLLSPRYLLPFAVVTGFLLFASASLLDTFGLTTFATQNRPYIGIAFLVSVALLVSSLVITTCESVGKIYVQSQNLKTMQKRLHHLTEPEKRILRGYIGHKTRSQYLEFGNGVVSGLESQKIIYQASQIGRVDSWAYNIQPWAWDYLNEHPELLSGGTPCMM